MVVRPIAALALAALTLAAPGAGLADDISPIRQEIFRRLAEGRRALEAGDAVAAAKDLCWASHRALNSRDAAWWCGRAKLFARDPEGAVKALQLATEIDPQHLGAWVDLGSALLAAGRPDQARPAFYKALELRKDYSPAWDGLARLAQRTGDEAKALEFFGKALEANPADARARLHRGQLHLGAGRLDQALADITEAARLRPEDAEVQLGLAHVRLQARMLDESLAAARRAAELTPRDARAPALTAEIFLAMDALSEAAEAARAALALDPGQPRALLALGEALGRQGKLPEALIALTPPDPSALAADELADFQDARARWQLRLEEQRRLESEAAREDAPTETLLALAEIRLAVSDFPAAADLAQRAAGRGLDAAAQRRTAGILGRAGRLTEAEKLLSQVASGGEATAEDWVNLGVLREMTGAPGPAGDAYRRALELPRAPADAHAGLARLALARGDRREAAAALRSYLDSNPPLEYTARAKEALARLEDAK